MWFMKARTIELKVPVWEAPLWFTDLPASRGASVRQLLMHRITKWCGQRATSYILRPFIHSTKLAGGQHRSSSRSTGRR